MTEKQIKEKVSEMFAQIDIEKYVDKAILSGALEIDDFKNDFRLPKIILSAALSILATQYEPVDSIDKAQVQNLKLFI